MFREALIITLILFANRREILSIRSIRTIKLRLLFLTTTLKFCRILRPTKPKLSESLDTFDAGGGTAYYDALAFALTETLRPLRGERTAIVALSDGDDNRSFLPFDSLLGSIQESGALIYPLYVPSGLIAASATSNPTKAVDPCGRVIIALTSKAETEGENLAQISGGVYYPITQLSRACKKLTTILSSSFARLIPLLFVPMSPKHAATERAHRRV